MTHLANGECVQLSSRKCTTRCEKPCLTAWHGSTDSRKCVQGAPRPGASAHAMQDVKMDQACEPSRSKPPGRRKRRDRPRSPARIPATWAKLESSDPLLLRKCRGRERNLKMQRLLRPTALHMPRHACAVCGVLAGRVAHRLDAAAGRNDHGTSRRAQPSVT